MSAPAADPASNTTSQRRVLIVDDNHDSATSMAMLLQIYGYDARIAHDGPASLDIAREFEPQAVVLDIGLPGMDGYQVAFRLRELGLQDPTLIAMTGYGQESDRRRSREAGFEHHLVKPISFDALTEILSIYAGAE